MSVSLMILSTSKTLLIHFKVHTEQGSILCWNETIITLSTCRHPLKDPYPKTRTPRNSLSDPQRTLTLIYCGWGCCES